MTIFQGGTKLPAWPKVSPIDGIFHPAKEAWCKSYVFLRQTTVAAKPLETLIFRDIF